MKIVTEADFLVSNWSGGKSTQLFIFPEGSTLEARDFDWRISSATIETEESDFTSFDGYERILIPLKGELEMEHRTPNGVIRQLVNQFELARFNGSWPTTGKGRVTDFNLIFKPRYHPLIHLTLFSEAAKINFEKTTAVLFLQTGSVRLKDQTIQSPALLFNDTHQEAEITCLEESRVISIRFDLIV